MNLKTSPQLSLENIIKQKRDEAQRLLAEVEGIKAEMHKILSEPPSAPPQSRLVEAFTQGVATTMLPGGEAVSTRMVAEKEVIYAALAIVRSWKRRHKKNWHAQEKELMNAVERLTWDK